MRGLLSSMMLFVVVLFALTNAKPADDKYTTKYDNIDIDEILNSERLLKNYFNCVMDKGPCTPDGQELRSKFSQLVCEKKRKFTVTLLALCIICH